MKSYSRVILLVVVCLLIGSLLVGAPSGPHAAVLAQEGNGPTAGDPSASLASPASSPNQITIPYGDTPVTIDGQCDPGEYREAVSLPFADAYEVTGTVYLKHDDTDLYVCMLGAAGSFDQRFARVYLDTDNAAEPWAQGDDLAFQVDIADGAMSSFKGTGAAHGYTSTTLTGWTAAATWGNFEAAEYRLSIALTQSWCSVPFGMAIYHHWVGGVGNDYGWPSNQYYDQPHTWATVNLDSPPCQLPVYQLSPPLVDPTTTLALADILEGIGGQQAYTDTSHADTPRFTVIDEASGAALERYGASGGFFAFQANEAFTDVNRGPFDLLDAKHLACNFLMNNELFPWEQTPPEAMNCDDRGSLPYDVNVINLAGQSAGPIHAISPTIQTGVVVRVPLGVDVGTQAPLFIPMQGPGGHLSLLFSTSDPQSPAWSLDDQVPGLAALAEPWFERQMEVLDSFELLDRDGAIKSLQGMAPGVPIDPGTPQLGYYVDDPAVPQPLLMPVWSFPGATAVVDGFTVTLRTPTVPAVPGLLPEVTITDPPDGTTFAPGQAVTLTGAISGGTGPYTYTWSLEDGTVLEEGVSSGPVTLVTDALPAQGRDGIPISLTVHLGAVDSLGAGGEDAAWLRPLTVPVVYLPLIVRSSVGMARPASEANPEAVNYHVGAEWVHYYNGTNADLPGTVPDGNGFYNGLRNYGWDHAFKWSNNWAWEKDWRDTSLGGIDQWVLERASFAYFAGHGSPVSIYFGVSKDSLRFDGRDGRFDDVLWVGFASCSTMNAGSIDQWFNALGVGNGARMLLGFHGGMADVAFGPNLVDNMRIPQFFWWEFPNLQRTIAQAWSQTAFEMNAGLPAYLYVTGNSVDPSQDKLPKGGDPLPAPPYPGEWYVWVWWE